MSRKNTKERTVIGTFEGADVTGTTLILRNTGDGLSQAMEIEPVTLHVGELVHLVIEAEVVGIRHDSASEDSEDLTRVHILRAGVSTIVEAELVEDVIATQRLKIEQAKGIEQLPFDDEDGVDGEGEPAAAEDQVDALVG